MGWRMIPVGLGSDKVCTCIKTAVLRFALHTDEVGFDSASPGVRLAVVQGLTGLVDNPLAQPLLKMVLPKLGPLLHDRALKVRLAVADLLLTVM